MANTVTALVRDVATGNTEQMNMPMTDGGEYPGARRP